MGWRFLGDRGGRGASMSIRVMEVSGTVWGSLIHPPLLISSFPVESQVICASQVPLVIKNPPANAEDIRDVGSIPGLGRSPGGGHGNPLQYSWLENPMDRGAWQATVHSIGKSWIQLKQLSMYRSLMGLFLQSDHEVKILLIQNTP